ncbi:DUF3558 family protein [Gordonia alkanivorans]|uniref:DUF3558 family protein n=1 Tax=Gordonia alkanivorans TaxID=84096 RepID=UPI0009DEF4E6|nr:DUF3558 family protein [Gordonia alkanivorans]MDH3010080.1 DUF3558 family protein [Gordonia alkanivorans]
MTLSACSVAGSPTPTGSPGPATSPATGVRQTDDAGRRLPFDTEFPDRWSGNNDGTSYEPCTQVSEEVVRRFGLDVESVSDVAGSNFQTARGCQWSYSNSELSFLSQFVGNLDEPEGGLSAHKAEYSSTTWHPDIDINGRRVIIGSTDPSDCAAYVQSGKAVVITNVVLIEQSPPTVDAVCASAADFLRATIDEIPE